MNRSTERSSSGGGGWNLPESADDSAARHAPTYPEKARARPARDHGEPWAPARRYQWRFSTHSHGSRRSPDELDSVLVGGAGSDQPAVALAEDPDRRHRGQADRRIRTR